MSNEAKTTKAYKISLELKEKLERLAAESGLETQEAFIEQLAALYELQQLKEGNGSGYAKQIEELEYHSRRNVELFVSLINTETAARLQQTQVHEGVLADRALTIIAQEQELAEQRKEAKAQADELVRISKEAASSAKLAEQLEATVADKAALVEEYRAKNDTLSGLVSEYKAAADQNKELLAEVSRLTSLTEKQGERMVALEVDVTALEASKAEQLRQAEERQHEALERQSERAAVEKERELLALRTEYQAKLEAAQTEATMEVRKLYEQLERQRGEYEARIREIQHPKNDKN